ncbi:uncharacterized protein PAC_17305 [Phialocephala subalpina]|uniref:Uncharacterized protein n=1 Tax=Phialocephala subalpina TaxID=576137 RepID=A0A1L7XQS5_9HELO|nr:uncharacterized protein PAC_17305 [Phialocephala subalpina]
MASSRTPLLAGPRRDSFDSAYADEGQEETTILYGFATSSPTRPFATNFSPTLFLRSLALLLAIPSFIIFIVNGPHYSAAITFLSFAIARQVVVLGSHFGSQIVVIEIKVVHPRFKAASAKAQESWIKKSAAAVIDGIILLGLLISLSLIAHEVDVSHLPTSVTPAVILGFLVFGLLLLSIPDFGTPSLLALAIAVQKPVDGVVKLATSVVFGEPEDGEDTTNEHYEGRRTRKSNPRMPAERSVSPV